ncbi:hypothetical protein HY745_13085, partial [Candidatus Desantisbacteria bacterium]|nr:hypothetical protein [Candidatus Desantisbacteria bacterium]
LKENIIPEIIIKNSSDMRINIWSAGCSTGEEPYSIAMLIQENFAFLLPDWSIYILGTDVCNNALGQARKGIYRKRAMRLLKEYEKNRYFEEEPGENFKINEQIKKMVEFRYFNLVGESYPLPETGQWDIIFCCNVTIYFKLETTKRVIDNYYKNLKPGGYLFIGYSETLQNINDEFELIEINGNFLYRKPECGRKILSVQDVSVLDKKIKKIPTTESVKIDTTKNINELYNEALEMFIKEDFDGAMEKITKYLILKPDNETARLLLIRLYIERENFKNALEESDKVIKINPLLDTTYYLRGIIHKNLGNITMSLDNFKKLLYLNKNFPLAYYYIAELYNFLGNIDDAVKQYQNAIKLLDKYPDDEPLEFTTGYRAKILRDICKIQLKKIAKE